MIGCAASLEEYELAGQTGFDYVELPCRAVCALDEAAFLRLSRKTETGAPPVYAMNIYCPPEIVIAGPGFDLDAAEVYAAKAAERGAALGVKAVGIGSPRSRTLPEGYDLSLARGQLRDFLSSAADAFGAKGITVCFEALGPCYCNFINCLSEAADVVSLIDHEALGIVLDFYNMEHTGEADIPLGSFLPRVAHAHISDDDGHPSQRSYLKPEKYHIHEARLRRLIDGGYRGNLTLETDVALDITRAEGNLAFFREVFVQPPGPVRRAGDAFTRGK